MPINYTFNTVVLNKKKLYFKDIKMENKILTHHYLYNEEDENPTEVIISTNEIKIITEKQVTLNDKVIVEEIKETKN